MNYNKKCEHKQLKYFEKTDKVVCLDCGETFTSGNKQDWYPSPNKGEKQERNRIIDLIENMKIEPTPEAEGTDIDDTIRTINNTLSDIVNKIKNG